MLEKVDEELVALRHAAPKMPPRTTIEEVLRVSPLSPLHLTGKYIGVHSARSKRTVFGVVYSVVRSAGCVRPIRASQR